jgi:putative ATPase
MNLAFRLRPKNFSEFVGQEHLSGDQAILKRIIKSDAPFSLILWGPPGSGKTTLANIIANEIKADFHALSAVETGKADLHAIIETAKENLKQNIKTILFIDEIHRWNKAQQDALLPHVENGTLNLIGATTENPSFEVISALLSRSKILVLNALSFEQLEIILDRALKR